MNIFYLLLLFVLSFKTMAGTPCPSCAPCPCGGSATSSCLDSSTIVRSTGPIKKVRFTIPSETIDLGCYGQTVYQVDLLKINGTVTVFSDSEVINRLEHPGVTGTIEFGSCTPCSGCSPCPVIP